MTTTGPTPQVPTTFFVTGSITGPELAKQARLVASYPQSSTYLHVPSAGITNGS